jgi:excinuclease ABC subunit B
MEKLFKLKSTYEPAGDQPKAIKQIVEGFTSENKKKITLLGAT